MLFIEPVKEIKGPLADLIQAHKKAEHQREFEQVHNYRTVDLQKNMILKFTFD